MKTLFITQFFPPVVGGSVRIYQEAYSRYEPSSIFVLTETIPGYQQYDARSAFRIYRQKPWRQPGLHPKYAHVYARIAWRAWRIVRKQDIKIIHCDQVLPAGLVGYIVSLVTSTPCYIYVHGEEVHMHRRYFPEKHVMPYVYRRASGVIVNSDFTRDLLLAMGVNPHKIHVLHPGVDAQKFRPDIASDYWLRKFNLNGERVLLTVGRLDERKGHDQVLRALPAVLQQFPHLRYVIAGTGQQMQHLQKLSQALGLTENVIFTGFVDDELLPALYNLADVFIMPNRETETRDVEGFGIVFLEANACGKPVIAGRSGGAENAVRHGETGLLVDGRSTNEIAAAVLRLLQDSDDTVRMGLRGRVRVEQEFSWQKYYEKLRQLQ